MTTPHPRWRVGWGADVHRFGTEPPVLLAGVAVDSGRGVLATSDGDVVAHAVIDAVLGAAGLGDIGMHFPSSDPQSRDADSMEMLQTVVGLAEAASWRLAFCDVTVISESVRIAPHRQAIRTGLAGALGLSIDDVSVKATSTDGLGWIGRDEGIAAMAAVSVAG